MIGVVLQSLALAGATSSPLPAPRLPNPVKPNKAGVAICERDFSLQVDAIAVGIACSDRNAGGAMRHFNIRAGDPIPRADAIAFVQPLVTMIALAHVTHGGGSPYGFQNLKLTLRISYDANNKVQLLSTYTLP